MVSASILVADDEPNIVLSLEFLLKQAGFRVRTVSDGEAALAAIAQDPPDLVLLDIMIPGRDGYAVCRAVRRVIGILSERDIVRAFAEFGADALTKQLAQVMTREVATCREAETAVSIMERMTTGKLGFFVGGDRSFPDLNRLFRECVWNPDQQRWEQPTRSDGATLH